MKRQNENRAILQGAEAYGKAKKKYLKPRAEVIRLELEQPVLTGSSAPSGAPDFGNGGRW